MTHDIQPPGHYVAGESLTQEFTIEVDGKAKPLTNATVEWYLLPSSGVDASKAILDGSDNGVTAEIVDASNGRIDVTLDQGATDDLGGRQLWQRLVVDDDGPGKQIWGGGFPVKYP